MANKYKLKAEYSNEEIDLNFYKASAFVVNDRSYERNVQLLSNGNYNFVENGLEPVARDFSGAIVFKTDSVKTARQRFEEFKKFFGKNTYRDYIDLSPYAFDSETLTYYSYTVGHVPDPFYVDMPLATHNVVRKTKLISIHPDGEERFCYVFLKSLQNIKYTAHDIAVSVTFGMLTAWMKLYEFELEGSSFDSSQSFAITDFGDMDEVVVGAEFQPNNYRADDTFTLTGKTSLTVDFSKSVSNPNWIYSLTNEYYQKGARVFVGEKINQYLVEFARGNTTQRVVDRWYEDRINLLAENGYKYLDPSKSARVTADYLNPTVKFESSRSMQSAGSQYSSYTGINGKIFYYAKFIED